MAKHVCWWLVVSVGWSVTSLSVVQSSSDYRVLEGICAVSEGGLCFKTSTFSCGAASFAGIIGNGRWSTCDKKSFRDTSVAWEKTNDGGSGMFVVVVLLLWSSLLWPLLLLLLSHGWVADDCPNFETSIDGG